jgi:uncharacterized protein YabN with tetrapyrrole methylase and pyrophosphatase domain
VSGALVVVGTGIGAAQLTTETRAELAAAEEVLFLVGDPISERAVLELAPSARSLAELYDVGARKKGYDAMTQAILGPAREGKRVCAAFYGHPGLFVWPAREAIRQAREEGIPARMVPAVSSLDCLFADLDVDPAATGCQIYEAGDLVKRRPAIERRTALVVLQAGVVDSVDDLARTLADRYGRSHELVVYEASPYPGVAPRVERVALTALAATTLSERSTVYVPPAP